MGSTSYRKLAGRPLTTATRSSSGTRRASAARAAGSGRAAAGSRTIGASEPSKSTNSAARAGSSTNESSARGTATSIRTARYAVPMMTRQSASDAPSGGSDGYAATVEPGTPYSDSTFASASNPATH